LLVREGDFTKLEAALVVINNWRACHSYPLHAIKMTLLSRAKKVNKGALIAQRLKRLPSIALKLEQNPNMKLSQMQDIGGCRAIMPRMGDVKDLIDVYKESNSKNPREGRPVQHEVYDYIETPKTDGYRSYHLIFKYQSDYESKKVFEGQRIEIQIRSRLQHAWATAVETVQTFTGQALKSKIKAGDPEWLRFFSLMGSAIALREKCAPVPGAPSDKGELIQEIRKLSKTLAVEDMLRGWGFAVQQISLEAPPNAVSFLLKLDPAAKKLTVSPFTVEEMQQASEAYLHAEKEAQINPDLQTVLVSVDSIDALREAYPNYYLDTTAFIEAMKQAIKR
jgi:ppGpp synthetase/RelA/SpoT-type nucleotidyltranferase